MNRSTSRTDSMHRTTQARLLGSAVTRKTTTAISLNLGPLGAELPDSIGARLGERLASMISRPRPVPHRYGTAA